MIKWFSLALGGIAGTFARYLLAGVVYETFGTSFPYGTLVVNLIGCFLIGLFAALAEEKFLLGPTARVLLMVGFCGAFTTFSTFMLETANLLKTGESLRAWLNLIISVTVGFLVFRAGYYLGETI